MSDFKKKSLDSNSSIAFLETLEKKSIKINCSILLPESLDTRVLKAAKKAAQLGSPKIFLLGNKKKSKKIAEKEGISLPENLNFIEINRSSEKYHGYAQQLYQLRKHKGITLSQAEEKIKTPTYLSALLLRLKKIDGIVSGAVFTSESVIRSALQVIGIREDYKLASSFFFMVLENGTKLFADCGLNINPNANELAEIAIATAENAQKFLTEKIKVAFISYGTLDSAKETPEITKVREALNLVKIRSQERNLKEIDFDGPLQYDAAINPSIAKTKAPQSKVAGKANVFIFPNLETGNSVYKAVQQSSKSLCIGPILQGFRSPINDLSRGATTEDIYYTILTTIIQSSYQ